MGIRKVIQKPGRHLGKYPVRVKLTLLFVLFGIYFLYTLFLLGEKRGTVDAKFADGKMVWQKYNCSSCHQLYGLGGFLGPDLTHVQNRGGAAFIQAMVQTGTTTMPQFSLDSAEMNALLYFLHRMNQSGNADPRSFSVEGDGFITNQ